MIRVGIENVVACVGRLCKPGTLPAAVVLAGCSGGLQGDAQQSHVDLTSPVEAKIGAADAEVRDLLDRLLAAARDQPADGGRRGELGMAQEVNGFADAALASYAQAASLDPREPRWPYYQALLRAHRGELEAALAHLARSIELDPGHAPAWLWRGTWLLDLDRLEPAATAFDQADSLGAGVPATLGRARVLLRQGRTEAALQVLEPLSVANPHPHVFKLLGEAHARLGQVREARLALAEVEHARPLRWPDAWSEAKKAFEASLGAQLAAARRALAEGRLADALRIAETLLRRHPDHQGLLGTLGETYRRLQRHEDALRTLRHAVEAHPSHYSFHLKLAEHYIRSGAGEDAMRHLERALELNPAVSWAHAQIGLLLLERQRLDDALAAFETALRQDPDQPHAYYYAGMTEASRQRWPQAIRYFNGAVRADPSFTLGHIGLGRSLAAVGRDAEAREALSQAARLGSHPDEVAAALAALGRRRAGG